VAELLCGVVRQEWVRQADLATLARVNADHVSVRGARRRTSDMVWRVRSGGGQWVYVYLLLEFQSRSDPTMALRMLSYLSLLYDDVLRQERRPGRLPPVLPIVLYNGLRRWKAKRQVSELIVPVAGLENYIPSLRYLLLDEGELLANGGLPERSLATLLFRLEHAANEDQMRIALRALVERLQGAGLEELERAFAAWLVEVLLPERAPDVRMPRVESLREFDAMMAAEKIDWSLRWKRQGLEEGRQKGRQEGKAWLLEQQLIRRFGPLSAALRERLAAASDSELTVWALNVLDAASLDEVFRR